MASVSGPDTVDCGSQPAGLPGSSNDDALADFNTDAQAQLIL
jgi:hypothetical protein